jgi:23S rRNA (cytidine1920-2'-O)/16S rRNA (cytidine1409-2'-O)-methyltransferase
MYGDVFTVPLNSLSEEPVDVILSDMTLEPEDSIEALSRVLPLLKEGGRLLQVIKISKKKNPKPTLSKIENMGLEIQQVIGSEKQEIYVVARKHFTEEKEKIDIEDQVSIEKNGKVTEKNE